MTIDERIELLLKAQASHEAKLNLIIDLHAKTQQASRRFMRNTDRALQSMARIQHRLADLEGGTQ